MKSLFYILLLTSFLCTAQEDYVVLATNDTVYGHVKRGNLNRNSIVFKNEDGRKRIHFREIKAWKSGEFPVVVIPKQNKRHTYYIELALVVDGRKKLYKDYFLLWTDNYFIYREGTYVQLTKENLNEKLISELLQCKSFSEKYVNENIGLYNLEDALQYYNQNCDDSGE